MANDYAMILLKIVSGWEHYKLPRSIKHHYLEE